MKDTILVIDAGNTKSKLALASRGRLTSEVLLADHEQTVAEALKLAKQHGAAGCLLCSVTEETEKTASRLRDAGLPTAILSVDMNLPFAIDYTTPRTLGPDRIAGAVGALGTWPGQSVLIIDAGTAITYDFLSADRHLRGGAISPGIGMRFRALHAFTAKLPLCNTADWDGLHVGTDTRKAIAAGVMNGVWAETNSFIAKAREIDPNSVIVITGGDYKNFDLTAKKGIFARPDIVLQGLALLANDNIETIVRT